MGERAQVAGFNREFSRAVIFANGTYGAGDYDGFYGFYRGLLAPGDFIICADGGSGVVGRLDLIPHVMIGDFDSTKPEVLESWRKKGVMILTYPREKDKTDTELAVDYALDLGINRIILLGALGGRIDHTLANIALLTSLAMRRVDGAIIDEHSEIRVIAPDHGEPDTLTFQGNPGDLLSLIPITPLVKGVTTNGLAYSLRDAVLSFGSSLGISNVFCSQSATIRAASGLMLAIAYHLR
ncbi:MAG: thiamine diphosphokinase [Firmicutes bacterium]|nr:thiamine diphosphokinase [Bacillota bacterium]